MKTFQSGKAKVMNIILMFVIFSAGVIALSNPKFGPMGEEITPQVNILPQEEKSVQIKTFNSGPPVTIPPSVTICPKFQKVDLNQCTCGEYTWCYYKSSNTYCILPEPYCGLLGCQPEQPNCDQDSTCNVSGTCQASGNLCHATCVQDLAAGKCEIQCIAKPVIYLYPEKKINVDVLLDIPGIVTVSDPLYPPDGWKNVTAYPDGKLLYQGKQYPYLYYETAVSAPKIPKEGIVIATGELETKIREVIVRLGLIKREQDDFLEYWIPKLQDLNSPYIFMTILDPITKNSIDRVEMTPNADTRIEIIAEFRPLSKYQEVPKLNLPKPPLRRGFTMVEWGGAIDQ